MPTINHAAAIIRSAEAVAGRFTVAERVALLDEHFPEVPLRDLAGLVKGLGL